MPKLSQLYPSKWLTAADLPEEGIIVTIVDVTIEKMTDGVEKPVLHFSEVEKGLVCNKTNAKAIEKMYGDDTDDWTDERISLFPTYTDFGGEQVECIRVKPKKPKAEVKVTKNANKSTAIFTPMTQAEADAVLSGDEDELPF